MSSNPANTDIDIQHDDEFEDFGHNSGISHIESKKRSDWMDDWDDDVVENFSSILREQRGAVH